MIHRTAAGEIGRHIAEGDAIGKAPSWSSTVGAYAVGSQDRSCNGRHGAKAPISAGLNPDGRKKLTSAAEIQVGLRGSQGTLEPTPRGPNVAAPERGSLRAACQLAIRNCGFTAFTLIGRFRWRPPLKL